MNLFNHFGSQNMIESYNMLQYPMKAPNNDICFPIALLYSASSLVPGYGSAR